MRTAAHTVLPNFAEVGSSTEKPPTSLAHSGLNFVGKARTVRQFSETAGHCCYVLQYCRSLLLRPAALQVAAVTSCSTADMEVQQAEKLQLCLCGKII